MCQRNKRKEKKYGKIPTKYVVETPWHTLCVDLIGLYTIKGKDKTVMDFMCLTIIDPASGQWVVRGCATANRDTPSS